MEKTEGQADGLGSKFIDVCTLTVDIIVFLVKTLGLLLYCIYEIIVPPEEKSVVGEIVLVTGAGHGIGKEIAKQYAELGAEVICVDINKETNQGTVSEIKKQGFKAHGFLCDVTSREKVLEVCRKIQEEVGDVTILINNAGIMPCKKFLSHSPEEIKKMFDVNVFAHFWLLEALLPSMMKKDRGHIVGISSAAGLFGSPHVAPYCASKFAVRGLMDALSEEFRLVTRHNVKFTTIYPYITDTGLCKKPSIRFKNFMRILTPAETAKIVVKSQRRGYKEMTAPPFLYYTNNFTKIMPRTFLGLFTDFLGVRLDEHES